MIYVLALSVRKKGKKIGFEKKFLNYYWPYPGWNTFRVDVFRINGLLNKAVRRSRKYSVFVL